MNLTVQQYLTGLERSVVNLPGLLLRWNELDEDLREHLADELVWMADVHHEVVARAWREGREDFAMRLRDAGFRLLEQQERIEQQAGLSIHLKFEVYADTLCRFATAPALYRVDVDVAMTALVRESESYPLEAANDDGYVASLDPHLPYAA